MAGSASARRALFARRHLQPSASAPSRGPSSPSSQSPRRESSPPRSPSPRPHQPPPSSLSPSGCHVSLSPLRPISPVRGLSPVTLQSHGSGSLGPSSSYTATSAQNQICLLPRGRAATARLVSYFFFYKNTAHCHLFMAFTHCLICFLHPDIILCMYFGLNPSLFCVFVVCIINAGQIVGFV